MEKGGGDGPGEGGDEGSGDGEGGDGTDSEDEDGDGAGAGASSGDGEGGAGEGYLSQAGRLNICEPRGQQPRHEASRITVRNPVTQTRHSFLQITQSLKAEALSKGLTPEPTKSRL